MYWVLTIQLPSSDLDTANTGDLDTANTGDPDTANTAVI